MSDRVHVLAQQLFGKTTVADCDLQEIKSLAQQFPYFAPAQFLLLEKLKEENAEAYQAQLQKAVLYYHDPLQFGYFISSDQFYTEVDLDDVEAEPVPEIETPAEEPAEEPADSTGTAIIETSENIEIAELSSETSEPSGSTDIPEAAQAPESPEQTAEPMEVPIADHPTPTPEETTPRESLTPDLKLQAPNLQLQTFNSEPQTGLSFEPYHTVDYFASQGIKLSQEEATKDKFGRQLKSFTEWLKTMKRLPAPQAVREDATEKKVQHLAEDSVHEADVVTEAMAEVWLKQGNKEKAIETYNKLGLLNPSKKPYFAALIENLKRS